MKSSILLLFLILITQSVYSAPVNRMFQDQKLPTQQMVEHQLISAPGTTGTGQILSGFAGITSSTTVTTTTFAAQPDVPRNLVLLPAGTTSVVKACTVVVSGTNIFDAAITENFSITLSQAGGTTGTKAFKTVSSVVFPGGNAACETGTFDANWGLGYGAKLGLKRCMDFPGQYISASLSGAFESTRATIAVGSSVAIEQNTVQLNSAPNSKDVDLYFMQNYKCFP